MIILLIMTVSIIMIIVIIVKGDWNNSESSSTRIPSSSEYRRLLREANSSASNKVETSTVSRNVYLRRRGWDNTPRKYFIAYNPFPLDILPGYAETDVIGMQYRENLSVEDTGWFNGFAFCEVTNQHDRYAIAICRDDEKLLGYVPRGDMELWQYIADQGGAVHAYGALSYDPSRDKWLGVAAIETYLEDIEERNELFEKPDITFYKPTLDLKGWLNKHQSEKDNE